MKCSTVQQANAQVSGQISAYGQIIDMHVYFTDDDDSDDDDSDDDNSDDDDDDSHDRKKRSQFQPGSVCAVCSICEVTVIHF